MTLASDRYHVIVRKGPPTFPHARYDVWTLCDQDYTSGIGWVAIAWFKDYRQARRHAKLLNHPKEE